MPPSHCVFPTIVPFSSFLEEPPFLILSEPAPLSSKCSMNRGVPCKVPAAAPGNASATADDDSSAGNDTSGRLVTKCCSGKSLFNLNSNCLF